jgi:hypothetical protein
MVIRKILDRFRRPAKVKHFMEDESLGTLTWEDHIGWRGIMTLANGKTATLTIDAAKTDESLPEIVRSAVKFVIANEPRIRDKIAFSMSEVYNGTWGGGDTITAEELARRITLTEVSVYEEGDGELLYKADDDLFTDHTICASLDVNGEIGEPELEG